MLPSLLPSTPPPVYDAVRAVSPAALLPLCLASTWAHSSYRNEQEIMTAWPRAASANHLANTVAMKTVSSNHVAADQVFRSIPTLPHLHINFAVWYILV